jgi:hypothetical protein
VNYKTKFIYLVSLTAALALIYAASFIFSPERNNSRAASYVWLDSRMAGRISRIVINDYGETIELVKKNQQWFALNNGNEYPARRLRVEDFIAVFTTRAAWPVRSSSASSHSRFGLENAASRVTIYGENSVLLDLLLGYENVTGNEISVRKAAQDEVRSGSNRIVSYLSEPVVNWYNLRLIPETEDGRIDVDSVQRLSVYNNEEAQIFTRNNRVWTVSGIDLANPDMNNIENYVRTVLNTEGDDFIDPVSAEEAIFNYSRVILEFGNGSVITIRVSEPNEVNKRFARVSNSEYIYSIPLWAAVRIFRDASSFETQ